MTKIIERLYLLGIVIGPFVTTVFYLYFDHKRRIAGMCLGAALFCCGVMGAANKLRKR